MEATRKSLYLIRISADYVVLALSFWMSSAISLALSKISFGRGAYILFLSMIIIWFVYAGASRIYDEFRSRDFGFELGAIGKATVVQLLSSIVILFFLKETQLSRFFVVTYAVILFIGLTSEKFLVRRTLEYIRRRGRNLRNLVIVGAGIVGRDFYDAVQSNPQFGYNLLGFVDDTKRPDLNGQSLGSVDELEKLITARHVSDVIIALQGKAMERIEEVLNTCDRYTTRVRIVPEYSNLVSGKYSVTMFGRFPVISVRESALAQLYWRIFKRVFDIVFTVAFFLLIGSWLWPLICALQKMLNPGPLYYKPTRWGRDGHEFTCYKFRSMLPESLNVDKEGKHIHTTYDDPRVTTFGRLLRKTNLDEIPQFINVLKGEMSVVGPRPHDAEENAALRDKLRAYMPRHLVKPGVTGWAQVRGLRGGTSDLSIMQKRTDADLWYIENWSFELDLRIILMTVWQTIKGDPKAY